MISEEGSPRFPGPHDNNPCIQPNNKKTHDASHLATAAHAPQNLGRYTRPCVHSSSAVRREKNPDVIVVSRADRPVPP